MAKKYRVGVNVGWCKGCSLCVEVCPKKVLEMSGRMKAEPAREGSCIGCRQCEYICPDLAITVTDQAD